MNPVTVFRQEVFSPQKLGSTFYTGREFPAHLRRVFVASVD